MRTVSFRVDLEATSLWIRTRWPFLVSWRVSGLNWWIDGVDKLPRGIHVPNGWRLEAEVHACGCDRRLSHRQLWLEREGEARAWARPRFTQSDSPRQKQTTEKFLFPS